jgi:hypothetical protein
MHSYQIQKYDSTSWSIGQYNYGYRSTNAITQINVITGSGSTFSTGGSYILYGAN